MSGKKSIGLFRPHDRIIHTRYRYKHPEAALRRAVLLAVGGEKYIQAWDLDKGKEVFYVQKDYRNITITMVARGIV